MQTFTSVPAGLVMRHHSPPSIAAMIFSARATMRSMSSKVRSQFAMPSSTDPILAPRAQLSATGLTCAKRLAHSRLVVMMMTSDAFIAAAKVFDGSIDTAMDASAALT